MFLQNPPSGVTDIVTIGSTTVVVLRKGDIDALDNICDLAGHVVVGLQLPCGGKSDSHFAGSRPDYAGRQSDFGAPDGDLTVRARDLELVAKGGSPPQAITPKRFGSLPVFEIPIARAPRHEGHSCGCPTQRWAQFFRVVTRSHGCTG